MCLQYSFVVEVNYNDTRGQTERSSEMDTGRAILDSDDTDSEHSHVRWKWGDRENGR